MHPDGGVGYTGEVNGPCACAGAWANDADKMENASMRKHGMAIAVAAFWAAAAGTAAAAPATLRVDVDKPGIQVSPSLYGIFFEDIGRSVDGGIYAELVQNRGFEDDAKKPVAWGAVAVGDAKVVLALDTEQPLNDRSPHSLRVEVTAVGASRPAGVANEGFHGIAVRKGAKYALSFYARVGAGWQGPLCVNLETYGATLAAAEVPVAGGEWKKYECELTAADTYPEARLSICAMRPGTFWLDMVSLFPKDTWKGRANGLRPDLAEMLLGLKPAFVRFPGGCWVEGDTMATAYRWKTTIGDVAQRRSVWNLWDYMSSNGIGYHEYLQMCEDLGAEALFVVNVGMSHKENVPMDKMGEFVQDALDAIEYANGPADSKWGAERARNGHPAPFHLRFMEIGNENGGPAYRERYKLFYDAIKAKYPEIRLVADVWGGTPDSGVCEIVDEHYYSNPEFFIQNAKKYDAYPRSGPKVYIGEYAVTQGAGNGSLRGALGEAVFMTGMERNSDVVAMGSYAPLFASVHAKKWNPDLIYFDASRCCGIPSYYVQQMFAANRADTILPLELAQPAAVAEVKHGAVGVGTWLTQAEFKDIKVTDGDQVLLQPDFNAGIKGWKTHGGQWKAKDGALAQTAGEEDIFATIGDAGWSRYTLSLKARKTGGQEGFLILIHARGQGDFTWLNLGGWGNSKHAIEVASGGGKSDLGEAVAGKIETGRWYDIRIETDGARIRTFLDGQKLHDVAYGGSEALHAVAGRAGDDVIVKTVNVSAAPVEAQVELAGATQVAPQGTEILLTSADPADENTLDEPHKVMPVTRELSNAAAKFPHTFPANSLTVLRIKAK